MKAVSRQSVMLIWKSEVLITEFVPQWVEEKGGDPRKFMNQYSDSGYSNIIVSSVLGDTKVFQKMHEKH